MLYRYEQEKIGEYIQFKMPIGEVNERFCNIKNEIFVHVHELPGADIVVVINVDGKTKEIISNVELKINAKDENNIFYIELIDDNEDDPLVYF